MNAAPAWLGSAIASDASRGTGVISVISSIGRLFGPPGGAVVGPAFTVQAALDDNLAVRNALDVPPDPGSVLVVAGHNESRSSTIGGLLALELQTLGLAGVVTDGLVRDSDEIVELGLSVWGRGVTPLAPSKKRPGRLGVTIEIGGVEVAPGDLVIADADGIVIWPGAEVDGLLAVAAAKNDADTARASTLRTRRI